MIFLFFLFYKFVFGDDSCSVENGYSYCKNVKSVLYKDLTTDKKFMDVVSMDETTGECVRAESTLTKSIFDHQISVHLRGPLKLNKFGVYIPKNNLSKRSIILDKKIIFPSSRKVVTAKKRIIKHYKIIYVDLTGATISTVSGTPTTEIIDQVIDNPTLLPTINYDELNDENDMGNDVKVDLNDIRNKEDNSNKYQTNDSNNNSNMDNKGSEVEKNSDKESASDSNNGSTSGSASSSNNETTSGSASSSNNETTSGSASDSSNGSTSGSASSSSNGSTSGSASSSNNETTSSSASSSSNGSTSGSASSSNNKTTSSSASSTINESTITIQNESATNNVSQPRSLTESMSSTTSEMSTDDTESNSGIKWVRDYEYINGSGGNVVVFDHLGGEGSGTFSYTFGNSISYSNNDEESDYTVNKDTDINLQSNNEIVIMTNEKCNDECDYVRSNTPANNGFPKGEKLMYFELSMPHDTGDSTIYNYDMPAVWLLNAKIPRTLQYGKSECSCWLTGCGEIDLLEILYGGSDKLITFMHLGSVDGYTGDSLGSPNYIERPLKTTKYLVFFKNDSVLISQVDVEFKEEFSDEYIQELYNKLSQNAQSTDSVVKIF